MRGAGRAADVLFVLMFNEGCFFCFFFVFFFFFFGVLLVLDCICMHIYHQYVLNHNAY